MNASEVLGALKKLGTEHHKNQFTRFGIQAPEAFGVKSPDIQKLAKRIGKDQALAILLYEHPAHEV